MKRWAGASYFAQMANGMDDLFGHVAQKDELFREPVTYTAPQEHTPETVRA